MRHFLSHFDEFDSTRIVSKEKRRNVSQKSRVGVARRYRLLDCLIVTRCALVSSVENFLRSSSTPLTTGSLDEEICRIGNARLWKTPPPVYYYVEFGAIGTAVRSCIEKSVRSVQIEDSEFKTKSTLRL